MPYLHALRGGASLIDVFKAFPQTSAPLIEFHEILVRGPSPFTATERELIAAYVSGLNGGLVEGLGIELERSYVAPASKRLAERGYLPLLGMMKR